MRIGHSRARALRSIALALLPLVAQPTLVAAQEAKPGDRLDGALEPSGGATGEGAGGRSTKPQALAEEGEDEPDGSEVADDVKAKVVAVQALAEGLYTFCASAEPKVAELSALCGELCATAAPASVVDYCGLRDPVSATAAVISDPASVRELSRIVQAAVAAAPDGARQPHAALRATSGAIASEALESAVPSLLSVSSRTIELGLAGLAKLIEDRARREGVGWFLQRMADDICWQGESGDRAAERVARKELTEHWFPALCGLAEENQMLEYGAGASMLRALKAAIESDLKGWPGAAAGLGLAAALRQDLAPVPASIFECAATDHGCRALVSARGLVQKLVAQVIAGEEVASALSDFGERVHEVSSESATGSRATRGFSPALDLLACAATIPAVLSDYQPAAELAASERAPEALLLAALTHGTACAHLTVSGKTKGEAQPYYRASGIAGQVEGEVERVSTIVRLRAKLKVSANRLAAATRRLVDAAKRYRHAVATTTGASAAIDKLKDLPVPEIKEVSDAEAAREVLEATEEYLRSSISLVHGLEVRAVLQTSVDTATAALAVASAASEALRSVLSPELLPGLAARHPRLCSASPCTAWSSDRLSPHLTKLETSLDGLESALDGIVPALDQRWDRVVIHASATLRSVRRSDGGADAAWAVMLKTVGRYAGVVAAIATEEDPDAVARAIDEVASPVGGWRRKQDAAMLTISAHPGLFAGGELRWGQYGVTHHDGESYVVPPVLTFPLGFEASVPAGGGLGLFVPLLDPLAFLQYDPSEDGRLPGAQISTAIALGLGARFGIPGTPFSLMPLAVFRPAFRAWESQLAGTGANVVQLGVTASIDVTLWDLWVNR